MDVVWFILFIIACLVLIGKAVKGLHNAFNSDNPSTRL